MTNEQEKIIREVFNNSKSQQGVCNYLEIMELLKTSNIIDSSEFRKKYIKFYKVRRNIEWQNIYFSLMKLQYDKKESFDTLLYEFYKKVARYESSYISKLVATLDLDKPVWDKHVLKNIGISFYSGQQESRLRRSILTYQQIVTWHINFAKSDSGRCVAEIFDEIYGSLAAKISNTKKIDFLLWRSRGNDKLKQLFQQFI